MVQATSNATGGTEDEFIELDAPTGVGFFLKRVRVSCNTPNSDVDITPRITQDSSRGTGGVTATIVKKRPTAPAPQTLALIKTGTTVFSLGTVTNTVDQTNLNGRAVYEWIPRGNEEYVDSGPGATPTVATGTIAIIVKVSSASTVLNLTAEWEE